MKIILAGGGSGGPVTPVLAVALEIKKLEPKTQFLFVGTRKGPEKKMVADSDIKFVSIPAAKWRRYFSILNLFSPFVLFVGFIKAYGVVKKFKPDVMFAAGGFVAVPVAWAAKLQHVKIVIHQQDAQIGLANKLMAPFANQITTVFEKTAKDFYGGSGINGKWKPAEWVGNPVRSDLLTSRIDPKKYFHLHNDLPILLVLGGATGSFQINQMIEKLLPELVKSYQVVHQTGKGKNTIEFKNENYHSFELIPFAEYSVILKLAHLVVARAGLSTLAELSALGKVAIIIPMPNTHQEENARILIDANAALVLTGKNATVEMLARIVNKIKYDKKTSEMLSGNISKLIPKDAARKLAHIIIKQTDAD